MKAKTYDQLLKDNKRLKFILWVFLLVALFSVLFIGTMNINTTNAAKSYEAQLSMEKAKSKVFEDELMDLKRSGTCLERIAMFDGGKM